jgi:BirA family transcriptional regulator, biotin operon repressor / biotin---[acetyl-CoA-carboxylase] ligase
MSSNDNLENLLRDFPNSCNSWDIVCVPSINSTNANLTDRFCMADKVPRMILWADEQTGGRGRLARKWQSVPGLDITASVCFPSPVTCADAPKLSLVAGIALVTILREEYGIEALARWPNDVVTQRGKIAGILSVYLAPSDGIICGIGINVNSRIDDLHLEAKQPHTTVYAETGSEISREALFVQWLRTFEKLWPLTHSSQRSELVDAFDPVSFYKGKKVRVYSGAAPDPSHLENYPMLEGLAGTIDSSGSLLIALPESEEYRVGIQDVLVAPD